MWYNFIVMKELERQYKALANRRRLAILKFLMTHRQATVGEIAKEIKLTLKATSKHLRVLASADFVDREQKNFVRLLFSPGEQAGYS